VLYYIIFVITFLEFPLLHESRRQRVADQ